MANILYAWELGGGFGHIAPYRRIFEKLIARGHTLTLVLRDLSRVKNLCAGFNATVLQAPIKINLPADAVNYKTTYAHILKDSGFGNEDELAALVSAWRKIFELTRPDLALCEHAPAALLALRGLPVRKMVFGTGFTVPPDVYPLPTLRPWEPTDAGAAKRDEDLVLLNTNKVLTRFSQPPLARIAQLFSDTDDVILKTYPELDHYGLRREASYWGLRTGFPGADFEWPAGNGPRLFVYMRPFQQINVVLQVLKDLKYPAIVYCDAIAPETEQRFTAPHLRFERRPLYIAKVAAECSLAILNGGHNTCCELLLAGKPILTVPLFLEQLMFSVVLQRLGVGLFVMTERIDEFAPKLGAMLSSGTFSAAAQQFAARYSDNDPAQIDDQLVARIEEIIDPRWLQKPRRMPSPLRTSSTGV